MNEEGLWTQTHYGNLIVRDSVWGERARKNETVHLPECVTGFSPL